MLSSPRKPPAKRCLPVDVLAVDPPGEVDQQLLEHARQEQPVARPARPVDLVYAPAGPGVDRRIDVAEARTRRPAICPLGCMYHSRRNSMSCSLANSGSTWAKGIMWNARSQAAYQGYSHLSGMEITSRLKRCRQSVLRPCLRAWRRGRQVRVAVEPVLDDVMVKLLRPEQPGVGLAADAAVVFRHGRRNARRR